VAAVGAAAVVVATRGGDNGGSDQSQQPGTGDVAFRLRWSTAADLDLYVQEPNGNVIYYANRTSSTNGQLDIDSNAACGTASASPVENVYWPTGTAPHGTYTFWANHYGCGLSSAFTLQVLRGVGGSVAASYSGNLAPYQDSTHYTFVY
jgi:uncharacterized protein YfaP (DUF2135 family)